jgi:hypothetical protein
LLLPKLNARFKEEQYICPNMKKINAILYVCTAAVLFVSCSHANYPTEKADNVDFSKYKTYAFLRTNDTAFAKLINKDTLENTLAQIAMAELSKKGFTMDKEHPDCYFRYTLVLKRSYDVSQQQEVVYEPGVYTPAFDNQARIYYFSSDNRPEVYNGKMDITYMREGTFVIDMIDSKEKRVIWRTSYSSKKAETQLPPLQMVADIIVPQMLDKLPRK